MFYDDPILKTFMEMKLLSDEELSKRIQGTYHYVKKFAYFPIRDKNNERIWLKEYYEKYISKYSPRNICTFTELMCILTSEDCLIEKLQENL